MPDPNPSNRATNPDLERFIEACRARVAVALERVLPGESSAPRQLHRAMRYAALGDGKRIRPILVYGVGRTLQVTDLSIFDAAACAVELIHAYSLVHDDLPAMDDDDLRRGRPTCHRAFDEATSILTGDALQALAFHVLAHDQELLSRPTAQVAMLATLAQASGSRGMVGGQALDIAAVGQPLELGELEYLHILKTGALIRAAVRLAIQAAGRVLPDKQDKALDRYAKCVGLAFQVQDDVLDVIGEAQVTGKTGGKDAVDGKPTYPGLIGLDAAREMAAGLIEDALASLKVFGAEAEILRALARYIIERNR
jgi:farnesyl diphosphate synthase